MAFNVLIVDDSSTIRKTIGRCIQQTGLEIKGIFEAGDGEEALAALGRQAVDVVLTDINMPKMNGVQLLTEMKQNEKYKAIPVLMITTEAHVESVLDATSKGAVGYIKKPFTPGEIKEQLLPIFK